MAPTLEELIYKNDLKRERCRPHRLHALEIWAYSDTSYPEDPEELQPGTLRSWFERGKNPPAPSRQRPGKPDGGLRLLCHIWSVHEREQMINQKIFPFDYHDFEALVENMHVPHTYIDDIIAQDTTFRFVTVPAHRARNTMIIQSPDLKEAFMTLIVNYDPESNVTTGYLGYVSASSETATLDKFLPSIRTAAVKASHPSFLPTLTLQKWAKMLRHEMDYSHNLLRQVQTEIKPDRPVDELVNANKDFARLHHTLMAVQRQMSSAIPDFVSEFARFLTDNDGKLKISGQTGHTSSQWDAELGSFIEHLRGMTQRQMERKERLISRHEMQLKVLYTIMQQRDSRINYKIAVEAKADSTAMKIISIVTMVFLPPTAVATIFSMGPFFSVSEDLLVIHMSPKFWIYWAVTIPMTMIVLLIWACWLKWSDFTKKGQARPSQMQGHGNIDKFADMLSSDRTGLWSLGKAKVPGPGPSDIESALKHGLYA